MLGLILSSSIGLQHVPLLASRGAPLCAPVHAKAFRTRLPLLVQSARPPDLPPSTEEGGPLSDILPLQLLIESQAADRSGDLGVGEDAGAFSLKDEKWGDFLGRDWIQFFQQERIGIFTSALYFGSVEP